MSTSDLQNLFANLRPKTQSREASAALSSTSNPADNPTSSSNVPPLNFSLPISNQTPTMSPGPPQNPMSPGGTGSADALLRLLNFGSATAPQPLNRSVSAHGQGMSEQNKTQHESNVTASDLMARFMSPPATSATQSNPFKFDDRGGGGGGGSDRAAVPPSAESSSQDALLKMLSKANTSSPAMARASSVEPSQVDSDPEAARRSGRDTSLPQSDTERVPISTVRKGGLQSPALHNGGSGQGTLPAPAESGSKPAGLKPLFTYTNPFEALSASRSTPKATTPVPQAFPAANTPSATESSLNPIISQTNQTPAWHTSHRKILTPKLSASKALSSTTLPPEPPKPDLSAQVSTGATKEPSPPQQNVGEHPTSGGTQNISATLALEEKVKQGGTDEWEDAEDSPAKDDISRVVPVYHFPIQPFVSITLNLQQASTVGIREDSIMEISRLKKEFDQVDRSLAAATTKYISYALPKNGGLRIIRQDDGSDRQVFKNSHDRIFHVSFCTTSMNAPPSEDQAVLGTGVSGAVYYATVCKDGNDLFEKNELELESLIFPPFPPADENTAGGVLKTRAKRSSRHPEFFGIGRGKSIQLIWPATALSPKYGISNSTRKVDIEKFYQERSLQISTGKAGKDFVFSEDDTLIVSLDKTGRLRFWDIRRLIDETNATAARVLPYTVDLPLLSLSTASPAEKSWPTSVLFVDKARAYTKGGALRYVLVGLRQNHTLQLWDIALGKAVQELNFPHENETDGICSVAYHPNTGIIVVAHPTRNSLFFIHLSAPRYTLSSSLSQAAYVQRIASKDPEIKKPDSTACMTGIRELSFAEKGQLRSVELLPVHKPTDTSKPSDERAALFELYVVHSKGVTCLGISKEDLGWDADSKVIDGVDAKEEGLVTMKELKLGSVIEETVPQKEVVEEPPTPAPAAKSSKKKTKKPAAANVEKEDVLQPEPAPTSIDPGIVPSNITNGEADTQSKKTKKKQPALNDAVTTLDDIEVPATQTGGNSTAALPYPKREDSLNHTVQAPPPASSVPGVVAAVQQPRDTTIADTVPTGISADTLEKEMKNVELTVATEFRKELNKLYDNLQNERVVQDSSNVARQEAVLRLVSTTLTNNVEKSLTRILAAQVQQFVVPAVTQATVQVVSGQVADTISKSLQQTLPREISVQVPPALTAALQNSQMAANISDRVSKIMATHMESAFADLVKNTLIPTFGDLAISCAEQAASRVHDQISGELDRHRAHQNMELGNLSSIVQGMAETLQAMSSTQVTFQNQILQDRRHIAGMDEGSPSMSSHQVSTAKMSPLPAPVARASKPKTKEEIELAEITALMDRGNYEEGSIKWLQSLQPVELFDNLFVQYTPEYLSTDVSSLVAFSIAVTVGNSLLTNTARRLEWISAAFASVDIRDPEIADLAQHAPALLSSLIQRLESLYMTTAEQNHSDPILKTIPSIAKSARDMRAALHSLGTHS